MNKSGLDRAGKIGSLKVELLSAIKDMLPMEQFTLKAAKQKFLRGHDGIVDSFQLVCLNAKPGYRIQPDVGVRVERVENIFHETSGFESKYQKDTSTIGTSIGALVGKGARPGAHDCEFLLESTTEISIVAEKLIEVFQKIGLPFYEQWSSLQALDAELNSQPAKRSRYFAMEWFRSSKGLIVAKLVGRKNYDELVEIFTGVMKRDNKGFYFKRFQALVDSLKRMETAGNFDER